MPKYIISLEQFDEQLDREIGLEEVVRCKDCKYYLQSNEKCELIDTRLHFYETDNTWTGDCFCSWGERREASEDSSRRGG